MSNPLPSLRPDGLPRRIDQLLMTQIERDLLACQQNIEPLGADEKLTKAQILIAQARDLVADFLEEGAK